MALYASLDLMVLAVLPLDVPGFSPRDVWLKNCLDYPNQRYFLDGPYRKIDGTLLRWMQDMITYSSENFKNKPEMATKLEVMKEFMDLCLKCSDVKVDKVAAPRDYRRPDWKSCVLIRNSFDLWDWACNWMRDDADSSQGQSDIEDCGIPSPHSPSSLHRDRLPIVKCPYVYTLVRGDFGFDLVKSSRIPQNATHYHIVGNEWHEIPDHWKCVGLIAKPKASPADSAASTVQETANLFDSI